MGIADPEKFLRSLFASALDAVSPARCLGAGLPRAPSGRTVVVGAGKAAAAMAREVERHWPYELEGVVVTRYGHGAPCRHIEVVEAAHPVPDAAGLAAAARILAIAHDLGPDDHLLCLISGGGSALLSLPAPGVTLQDKQAINRALLASGANIHEMNTVRKHLSAIKGGRLAQAAYPAHTTTLIISDVPGDDPATVASGPTVPDPSTLADARAVLSNYGVEPPAPVLAALTDPSNETPGEADERLGRSEVTVLANAQDALRQAAETARAAGVTPVILGDTVEGEARDVALVHAAIARQIRLHGEPFTAPCVLLSGGETTVTVRGTGRGGRNAEFLLALTLALDGMPGVYAMACDTDGIDGTETNAGCLCDPHTLARAAEQGISAAAALADNDGFGFFQALDGLVVTGPTLTNVNDFRAVLIT